jgi:DUF4097 and DUF4098 domain-containing protein YvlB
VPRNVAVKVDDDHAKVTASGFTTALRVDSANGEIVVDGSSGDLTLNSSNGVIRGRAIRSGQVHAGSHNGLIDLAFASSPDLVDASTGNGTLTLTLPDTGYRIDAAAHNGVIRDNVRRNDDSEHAIKARAGNGEIQLKPAGHS